MIRAVPEDAEKELNFSMFGPCAGWAVGDVNEVTTADRSAGHGHLDQSGGHARSSDAGEVSGSSTNRRQRGGGGGTRSRPHVVRSAQ